MLDNVNQLMIPLLFLVGEKENTNTEENIPCANHSVNWKKLIEVHPYDQVELYNVNRSISTKMSFFN